MGRTLAPRSSLRDLYFEFLRLDPPPGSSGHGASASALDGCIGTGRLWIISLDDGLRRKRHDPGRSESLKGVELLPEIGLVDHDVYRDEIFAAGEGENGRSG